MQASQRACIEFTDVAASFSVEEWDLLNQWQKDLYCNVMREIHSVLLDLGYSIRNSAILFRVVSEGESGRCGLQNARSHVDGCIPDILLRINYQGDEDPSESEEESRDVNSEEGCQTIKLEDEIYRNQVCDSPADKTCCYNSPGGDAAPSSYRLDVKHELNVIISEPEDNANPSTSAEEEIPDWSPIKVRLESWTPSSGDAPEPACRSRVRRRKGIARKIKPMAALQDSDLNRQTQPKENEVPRLPCSPAECKSGMTNAKMSYESDNDDSGDFPYPVFEKDFCEDPPISFQQRGQTFIVCSFCGKTFCNNSSFQVHLRIHTGERPFKCTDCDKSFIRSSHLKIHLRTHTGERPYQCSQCEKSFRDNSSFARHQRIHTGEKPYQCSTCGKCFRKKSNLQDHHRTHTGERPYVCKHCDKSFHQKSNLRVHERNHHNLDYGDPTMCSIPC